MGSISNQHDDDVVSVAEGSDYAKVQHVLQP